MNNKIFLSILFFILPLYIMKGLEYAHFDHFSTNEGLISNRIMSLTHDSLGFIWIATDFGMERFDGTKFKHYQKSNYPSICRDDIFFVQNLGNNKIALGGYNGLLLEYDAVIDDFKDKMPAEFEKSFYKEVRGIYIPKKGDKYAYTIGGLYRYDEKAEKYMSDFAAFDSLQYKYIRTMYIDKNNCFWIGSIGDLQIYDQKGNLIKKIDFSFSPCEFVTNIIPFDDERILVSSMSNELWVFDIKQNEIIVSDVIKLPFYNVTQMFRDSHGRFWFATDGCGLWYTDDPLTCTDKYKSLQPFNSQPDDIKKIYAMMEDHSGNIWIGTQNSGLWRYRREKYSGVVFSSNFGFPTVVCSSFSEDDNHNLIVGSDGSGVFSVSSDYKKIRQFNLENNNIPSLSKSSDGRIWVASWGGGVFSLDPVSGVSSKEEFKGIDFPIKCFFSVSELPNGEVLLGSGSDGLYVRGLSKKWYKQELKDDSLIIYPCKWVFNTVQGKNDAKWILTTNTLFILQNGVCRALLPDVSSIKSHNPFSLMDAVCDKDGNLFVTTNSGVIRFSSDGNSYEILDFLPSASYRIIRIDDNETFWVAGSDGILSFNYDQKSYSYLHGNYSDMSKCYFYSRAGFKDSKGKLYFGTNAGFFTFDPQNIVVDTSVTHLAFSELYLSREKIKPYHDILQEGNISDLKKIELKYNQSDIVIKLDVIDFSDFNKVQCRYRLCGFNDDWIELGQKREIIYNYIPSGNYKLEVEAYRSNVNSERKTISLELIVLPPWWSTWWFKLIVVVLLILVVLFVFWMRVRNMVANQQKLRDKVQERTQKLNIALQEKDRLISVIAHDLKNPMFAIVGALEILLKRESVSKDSETETSVNRIYSSARSLQNEMLKLLKWARSGQNEIICRFSDANIEEITDNILLLLRGMINSKHLIVTKNYDLKNYVYADPRMLEIIIRNLLTNSIKFTPSDGTITIRAWQEDAIIKIEIVDTGVGMNENQLKNLFSAEKSESTLGTDKESGSGLGFHLCNDYVIRNGGKLDVKSNLGQGTHVMISLSASDNQLEKNMNASAELDVVEKNEVEVNNALFAENTVLIVDDDPLICSNLSNLLEKYVTVVTASNGKEALSRIKSSLPDVILSDVEMPVMNGIELEKILSHSSNTNHIPLLFISSKSEEDDRMLGLLSGAIDYIAKPFSQSELLIKLTNILKVRQEQQKIILRNLILGQSKTDGESEVVNPFLEKFLKVLELCYENGQLTVDDLAKEMTVSQSTLNRKIKSLTDKTPLELLTEFRLNKALKYLNNNSRDMSVSDIAYNVGFNDPAYFTRRFRTFFGYPPSQMKNS